MGLGDWETELEQSRAVLRAGEQFFRIDINPPEYKKTYSLPRYAPDEHRLYLHPFLPQYGEHETRHTVHYRVIQDVVERNEDAIKTYYAEELDELTPVPSGTGIRFAARRLSNLFGVETATDTFYDAERTADLEADELALQVHGKNRLTNPVQDEFFADNRTRSEVSLNAVVAPAGVLVSGIGTAKLYAGGIDLLAQEPWTLIPPLAVLASYRAVTHVGQSRSGEPLIDAALEDYDAADRRRAMLYNSRVKNNIDDFLALLDEYGIE